jgi:hypothetical protein
MLRTSDLEHFIAAQVSEIRGLERMQAFQYKNIA